MAISDFVPPAVLPFVRRIWRNSLRFEGHFDSWSAAEACADGYHQADILDRIVRSTRAVVRGEAAFERDGVVFAEPEYPFHIIAGLLSARQAEMVGLSVVDLGGALGSLFRQCRAFLPNDVLWHVVEQPHYVAIGKAEFEDPELKFFKSISEISSEAKIDAVLASSVLQYLSDPWAILAEISRTTATRLIINRTPFGFNQDRDRIVIQKVPGRIYRASYPCWIFSRSNFLARILKDWELVVDFPSDEGSYATQDGQKFEFRNLMLDRRA